jgi:hypothetical protein
LGSGISSRVFTAEDAKVAKKERGGTKPPNLPRRHGDTEKNWESEIHPGFFTAKVAKEFAKCALILR